MPSSPSQSSIQALINACVPGGNYPATKMNPVLTFANQNFNITAGDPTATDDYSAGYVNLKSFWYNTLTQTVFICVDDTNGSAVWVDITPNPINPDAASVIDITRSDLANEITGATVNTKAIYRITDAEAGTSVMRVYGITTSTIDTNAFKEGSWNGVTFVAGQVGNYNLGTDTFSTGATVPNIDQVLTAGNTANGYTVEISGAPDNNVSISSGTYTGGNNVAFGQLALNSNTGSNNAAIGNQAMVSNTGSSVIGIGFSAGRENTGDRLIAIGPSAGRQSVQNDNTFIGFESGRRNTGFNNIGIGGDALKDNTGNLVYGLGDSAAELNSGDLVIALGSGAALSNTQSNRFVIDNDFLPSFANHAAAASAITTGSGASAGNTYLYHNQATDSIGAVRL